MEPWYYENGAPVAQFKFLISDKDGLEQMRELPVTYSVGQVWSDEHGTWATLNHVSYVDPFAQV